MHFRPLFGAVALLFGWSSLTTQGAVEVEQYSVATDRATLPHLEPVVAVHPRDSRKIAVAAIAIEAPNDERFHDSWRVVLFISSDGARTWVRRAIPPTPSGSPLGDPNLVWTASGALMLTALVLHSDRNLHTWLWRSQDEGSSWTVMQVAAAADGSEDHPVLDADPTLQSPALTVFATIAGVGISGSMRHDDGAAFRPVTVYRPNRENNNLGAGLRLRDGSLLFSYYSMSGSMPTPLWAVRTVDGGRTWTQAVITSRHVPVGFPTMVEDRSSGPRRGRVYAVWVSDEETGSIMLAASDNGGNTWSRERVVHHDRSAVIRARPAVHVNRDGIVVVSWTDGRHDTGGRGAWCWDVYAAPSIDGGQTFSEEIRLTDSVTCSQTSANGAAGQRWRWGGDYAGIASDSIGRFYVAWSDTRGGLYQPRLARLTVQGGSRKRWP